MRFSIAFFIGDSVQHDPLCGKYVKYHGIQRMCRHCDCRSDDIDNPNAARVATLYKPWMLDPTDPERDAESIPYRCQSFCHLLLQAPLLRVQNPD
eukprot:scaffold2395_cov65-Cylindrotheca_fusiformis.AAC.1